MALHWDKPFEIVIADEDGRLAHSIADQLKGHGFRAQVAKSLAQAGAVAPQGGLDFLVAGYKDPQRLDVNQIKFTLRSLAGVRLIALLPPGLEAYEELLLQNGVTLVLSRDLAPRQIGQLLVTQGELRHSEDQNYKLRQMLDGRTAYGNLLGGSAPMRALYRMLDQVARTDAPVLILGEEGTERIDVARAIHAKSERALHPVVAIDCAHEADDGSAAHVFGPMGEGEFATGPHPETSIFARAEAGVVVLHRVEYLKELGQRRLLDFIHRPFFQNETPGNAHPLARVMVTSVPDLQERVNAGEFMRELYYRLSILQVRLPALRERREDIPMLAQHLLRMALKKAHGDVNTPPVFSSAALLAMFQYNWPGNVEELATLLRVVAEENVQGRDGAEIELHNLPPVLQGKASGTNAQDKLVAPIIAELAELALKDAKRVFETEYFNGLLKRTHGNMTLASRFSRVGRPYLYKKIKEYGIEPDEFR